MIVPKFSDSPDQTLRKSCTASWQKPQEEASLHFHMNGKWPLPQAKILSNILSGTTPLSMCQRPALQQDCWMTPFHEWPQTIKHLKPCLHRRLDGAHHFLFCLPRSYHPTKSSAECHTHLDSTALPPSKHLTRPDLMGGHLLLLMNENFFYRFYEIDDYYPFHK